MGRLLTINYGKIVQMKEKGNITTYAPVSNAGTCIRRALGKTGLLAGTREEYAAYRLLKGVKAIREQYSAVKKVKDTISPRQAYELLMSGKIKSPTAQEWLVERAIVREWISAWDRIPMAEHLYKSGTVDATDAKNMIRGFLAKDRIFELKNGMHIEVEKVPKNGGYVVKKGVDVTAQA